MKKIFTTLAIMLGVCSLASAQTKNQNEFDVSVGYGLAYVTANQTYGSGTGHIGGVNFAVSADHYLNESWSIRAKVMYDPKGWGNSYLQLQGKTVTGVYYSLNYITLPVTASWHFGKEHEWYVNAGPYVGFLTKASEDYNNSDLKSSFNSVDMGADLGLGLKLPISNKLKFFIEYDGQLGVSNILAHDSSGAQNQRSALNVGIKF
ncbi:porin family protein [Mucilaginibacter sp. UR6-11]|uniref:porin family protein n=1 Tax=Mucilaginibacter sp. UR6-11 TaxID=1435644 RepID=UPI001E363EFC|nr:porin family protein [Mucilaginibacter sp. UR6-11]MCC8425694.1 PorT family protein [Mucilaginibacter sp. UR6-11]